LGVHVAGRAEVLASFDDVAQVAAADNVELACRMMRSINWLSSDSTMRFNDGFLSGLTEARAMAWEKYTIPAPGKLLEVGEFPDWNDAFKQISGGTQLTR